MLNFKLAFAELKNDSHVSNIKSCYVLIQNEDEKIIQLAHKVFNKWQAKAKTKKVIIVDFSKAMEQKRLFIIHLDSGKIILRSKVCHGIGSGEKSKPSVFSNEPNSKMSSLGVMLTAETFISKRWGYSMRIDGLQNRNSNVRLRAITFHDCTKLSTPWSWGCFSTPHEINDKLINLTKNGTLIFAFSNQNNMNDF